MATTELTVQDIVRTGLEAVYVAAAAGDGNVFNNANKKTFLHIINGGGGSIDATFVTPQAVDTDLAVADRVVAVPAGEERLVGPFTSTYEAVDADNNIAVAVKVTFDIVTSLTVAALRVP